MFIPGLPKGLQNQLAAKLEESFDMYVDKALRLWQESNTEETFLDWWNRYKEEKKKIKGEKKKK